MTNFGETNCKIGRIGRAKTLTPVKLGEIVFQVINIDPYPIPQAMAPSRWQDGQKYS